MHGLDSDASMTAFSLIAMQETRPVCADIVTVSNTFLKMSCPAHW